MIINLSASLAKRLKVSPQKQNESHQNPNEEWYGHVFHAAGKPYILTIESKSVFSSIIEAKGVNSPEKYADSLIISIMDLSKHYGFREQLSEVLESRIRGLAINRTANKSAISQLNQMIYHAEVYLSEHGMSILKAETLLNEMPINAREFKYPIEMLTGRPYTKTYGHMKGS